MPVQTTKTSNIYFPDGCEVAIKASGESVYTDVGAINSAVTATLNYDINEVQTANAGTLNKQIRNMTIAGAMTLINFEPASLVRLGSGMFTQVDTAGSPIATIPDQVIDSGWDDNTRYALEMVVSSSDSTVVRTTAKPTLTSVTLDAGGTPEALTEDDDYIILDDPSSASGWSIAFISSGMATGSPKTLDITIDYGSNTPIANSTIYAGTSTQILTAYAMQFTHTDSDSLVRRLTLYSVDTDSGGFQINFKGANEDGVEEMPVAFTGKIDTSLTDGRQLFAWTIEDGAA